MSLSKTINRAFDQSLGSRQKKENALKPFTPIERMERILKNSAAFDKASYEADGGDSWIDSRREELFKHPLDKGLYAKASEEAKGNWKFAVWLYRKLGGKF